MLVYISVAGKRVYSSEPFPLNEWYSGFRGRNELRSWPDTHFITIF